MSKYKTMDANEAVARVAYKFTEVAGIYPITPASPMAEKIDVLSSNNEINFWGNKVKIVEMQSEAGAAAMVHGALQSGELSSTFTASQGLLLMIPTLYKLAGEINSFIKYFWRSPRYLCCKTNRCMYVIISIS